AFGFWLLAFGFWLLAFGFWLLAFGFWLLAFGFWLLAFGFWLFGFRVSRSPDHQITGSPDLFLPSPVIRAPHHVSQAGADQSHQPGRGHAHCGTSPAAYGA